MEKNPHKMNLRIKILGEKSSKQCNLRKKNSWKNILRRMEFKEIILNERTS